MSLLLSAQTGTVVTPEQLLGTEDEVNAGKLSQAERDMAELEEKMRAAGMSNG